MLAESRELLKSRQLLHIEDPLIGEVRAVARYMIYTAGRPGGSFLLTATGRDVRFQAERTGNLTPDSPLQFWMRSPGRWRLLVGLKMNSDTYRQEMTDNRGAIRVVETSAMQFMPGYFDEFERIRVRKRFNQNSEEMAVFYVLRYGDVYTAELNGSLDFFVEDLTMIRLNFGEDISLLDK